MRQFQDFEVHKYLVKEGDNFLPDEIIEGNLRVEDYSDIEINSCNDNKITGTCEIECHDDGEGMDISFNCNFTIEINDDEEVENIEFTDLNAY